MKPQTWDLAIFKFMLITRKAQLGHLVRAKLHLSKKKSTWNYIILDWEVSWKFENLSFSRSDGERKERDLEMQSVNSFLFFGVNLVWNIRQIFAWEIESADVR